MSTFPLPTRPTQDYHAGGLRFASDRDGGRKHAACDLITDKGTSIYAVADGKVIEDPYPFYHGSKALEVDHGDFTVRYGEISSVVHGLVKGTQVSEGDLIAYVGKMTNDSMLHFEMYSNDATGPLTDRTKLPFQRRGDLMDPTDFLDNADLRGVTPSAAAGCAFPGY